MKNIVWRRHYVVIWANSENMLGFF